MSADELFDLAGSPVFLRRTPSPPTSGGEPLYLHGIPSSSDQWIPFLERTGGIAPDLPGFGRSGKAANLDYTLEGHARFVEDLLDALGIERVRLVVHGWGAGGGLVFAQRHPQRVTRLVICDALPLVEDFAWRGFPALLRRRGLGELAMGSIPRWLLARVLRTAGQFDDREVAAIWQQFDLGTQRAILRLHRTTSEPVLAQSGSRLHELQMPSLVVWGESDTWFEARFAQSYAQRLPAAETQLVPGAGHWPWREDPQLVGQIAAFLTVP